MSEQPSRQETVFRITDLEYTNSQIDDKIIGVFRFEPSGVNKKGPTLIVLAEVEGVGYVYDQLIDIVNNEAEHSRTLLSHLDHEPVTRFEKVVQNINRAVSSFLETESSPINWSRINLFVLELSEGHMCLAGIGRLMNMFLQKQEDGSYKTYDLFGSLDQRVDVDPTKCFSNIICGDFHAGDLLMAGSRNFERLRNDLRLKERLATLPPVSAIHEIKQDLEKRGIPDDFVATVIACREAEVPKSSQPIAEEPKEKSTASLERLRRTEEETLRHLAPSLTRKEGKTDLKEPRAPRIGAFSFIGRITGLIRRGFRTERVRDVASMVHLRGMHAGFGSFLTRKRKTLIIGAVAIVLGSLVIGSLVKHQRNAAAERAAWNSSYDTIKAEINEVEYQRLVDESKARKTLAQALSKLETLDATTEERKAAIQELQNAAQASRTKLQRLQTIDHPEAVYTLPSEIANGALLSPIIFKGKLVFADRANEKLVTINLETKEKKEFALPSGKGSVEHVAGGKTSVIVIFEGNRAFAINPDDGTSSELSLELAEGETITDVTSYAGRLYVLDASSEQIWKHQSISGGFGGGSKYLQASSQSLNDATSLAIDSNVYALKSNGIVVRYFNGGQDGFALSTIDPALEHGDQIWADADNDYIAIADRDGKRIILATKEGRLVAQMVSPDFKGPTDLVGDPVTKKLYVVDGNAVYELSLSQN